MKPLLKQFQNQFRFAAALLTLGLSSCATLPGTDRYILQDHQVSPSLYVRMTHREVLSLHDIIELSDKHLAPGFVIHYLGSTGAVYRLGARDISRLEQARVSREVIDYLLSTPSIFGPHFAPYYPYPGPYYDGPGLYPYYGGVSSVIYVGPYGHRCWR